MKRFVLGVDVDGVLGDYEAGLRAIVEEDLGLEDGSLPQSDSWDFTNWPIDEKGFIYFHEKLIDKQGFKHLEPLEGAVDAVNALANEGIYIRIVTHRLVIPGYHRRIITDTVDWLDLEGFKYRDICFAADKATVGADAYVDDAPHNHEAIEAAGTDCILYDQPYNQHVDARYRAKSWGEVYSLVLDIRDERQ